MGYTGRDGETRTLQPFQVRHSPTSGPPALCPPTTADAMAALVALYFAALVAAIGAVGRTLVPPATPPR